MSSNEVIRKGLRYLRHRIRHQAIGDLEENNEAVGNWKFEQGAACPSKLGHGMAYAINRSTYGYRYSKRQSAKFNGPRSWPQPFLNQDPRACLSSHHVLVRLGLGLALGLCGEVSRTNTYAEVAGILQIEPAPSVRPSDNASPSDKVPPLRRASSFRNTTEKFHPQIKLQLPLPPHGSHLQWNTSCFQAAPKSSATASVPMDRRRRYCPLLSLSHSRPTRSVSAPGCRLLPQPRLPESALCLPYFVFIN